MADTMGKRLKIAMMEQDLRQVDIIEQLRSYGIELSKAQLSKIVNDEVVTPNIEFLRAIKRLLGLSLDYIIDGEEPTAQPADHFMTDEANAIGALVDKLPIELRTVLLDVAQLLYRLHTDQRKKEEELISLLEDNINLMGNGHRRIAREYIDRNRRHIDASEHSAREDR
jgi:transcriptional regulator with XRE-family HTH domain